MLVFVIATSLAQHSAASIDLAFNEVGLAFDGHGGLSAGGTTRLLLDYPEPQRSEILDYLFLPSFGASVAVLKLEIGGDTQSTDGAEPSHMHSRYDLGCDRGYEGWLAAEAQRRNPQLKIWSLAWGVPGWIGNVSGHAPTYYCDDNMNYTIAWLKCLRDTHGVRSDYLGLWNERPQGSVDYVIALRKALDREGFPDVGITVEATWQPMIKNNVLTNPAFNASIVAASKHYPCNCSTFNYNGSYPCEFEDALKAGKKFWAGEDVPSAPINPGELTTNWTSASCWGRKLSQHFVRMSATSTISWAVLWAAPIGISLNFLGYGFITAVQPWSGHYSVPPIVWIMAHWHQFAEPGWTFLQIANKTNGVTGGAGMLAGGGSYVTLVPPVVPPATSTVYPRGTFTLIVETLQGTCGAQGHCNVNPWRDTQQLEFKLSGGGGSVVAVWCSSEGAVFVRHANITIGADGTLPLTMPPDTICTVTTLLTHGTKGSHPTPPPASPFPSDHYDDFATSTVDKPAWGWSDVYGSFAVREYEAATKVMKHAMTQVATAVPTGWAPTNYDPLTLIGGNWSRATLSVVGRVNGTGQSREYLRVCAGGCGGLNARGIKYACDAGCCFNLSATGAWSVGASKSGSHGMIAAFKYDQWHNVSVSVGTGGSLVASVNGTKVTRVEGSCKTRGMVGVGCSKYIGCSFDAIRINGAS
jgi:galactosylceramidase